MSSSTFFLLPAYISFETTRAILSFAAVRSHIEVSPTLIAFGSELLKLVVATIFLRVDLVSNGGSGGISDLKSAILFASKDQASWRAYGLFAVPAVLYLINNILYLLGLQLTTPSLPTRRHACETTIYWSTSPLRCAKTEEFVRLDFPGLYLLWPLNL